MQLVCNVQHREEEQIATFSGCMGTTRLDEEWTMGHVHIIVHRSSLAFLAAIVVAETLEGLKLWL